tara:strand:- start:2607 stop:3425 length:819 start_codon:yes stop_codon:yes gene_type:complete
LNLEKIYNMKKDTDLISYCIEKMISKEDIHKLYTKKNIHYAISDTYHRLKNRDGASTITLNEIITSNRKNWKPCNKNRHIKNLKSMKLKGHSWHGAMPSMLHMSMQNKVRDCVDGLLKLDDIITIGADIMKHQYFMVATHDLLETTIIEEFKDTIPPTRKKSITDFVFKGVPYDLKNTHKEGITKAEIIKDRKGFAKDMYEGADKQRLRKQAKATINNWGVNRFYVMVEEQARWLTDPQGVLDEVVIEAKKIKHPIQIKIDGIEINVIIIAI